MKARLLIRPCTVTLGLLMLAGLAGAEPARRGPLPESQRDLIHFMAEHHREITRTVEPIENGYAATTTSTNALLASRLKEHVAYMKKRLDSGAMVRRWDPAFAELVDYHDQLEATIDVIENGVRVTVTGRTPEAVKVARNHARIVSGFVDEGRPAVRRRHETVILPSD